MSFLANKYFLIALTFGVFYVAQIVHKRSRFFLFNPILLTIGGLIAFLKLTGISYETYYEGGYLIEFWMKPAIVALGVPLYQNLEVIRKQYLPILVSQFVGCVTGIVSVTTLAGWLGASPEVILSIASKSVTTPIALEISHSIGGIPPITAGVVTFVGLSGGIFGFKVLQLFRVESPIAQGLSIGTAAHAFGTSIATGVSPKYGVYASLGLILNGILTALFTPPLLRLLGFL